MSRFITAVKRYRHSLAPILILFALLVGTVTLFANVADEVIEGEIQPLDEAILQSINQALAPQFDGFFQLVTLFGGVEIITVLLILSSLALARKRRWRELLFVLISIGGAALLNVALKLIFARERPELWTQIVTETSYSFPSGHAMASMAVALTVVLLSFNTRFRSYVVAAAIIYILIIGLSRLYLGVHYPSDILAGWSVSAAWVLSIYAILYRNKILTKRGK